MEFYFDNRFTTYGRYNMPLIKRQDVDLSNLRLIRFSDIVKNEIKDFDATVHFFIDDAKFDEVWKSPKDYLEEISQYKQTMSPDFSVYYNMAGALQVFNVFRSRWLGAYWQEHGMTVIPTLVWADKPSFEFCFDGVEQGSVVAVTTLGQREVEWTYLQGFEKMCTMIEPETVICYSQPFEKMYDFADIIEVPYSKTKRVVEALSQMTED
jgi:hypothetical protein